MNYPIPESREELSQLRQHDVTPETVAAAIAGIIKIARAEGRSLAEVQAEVLMDDALLDAEQRHWLGNMVAIAWEKLP